MENETITTTTPVLPLEGETVELTAEQVQKLLDNLHDHGVITDAEGGEGEVSATYSEEVRVDPVNTVH